MSSFFEATSEWNANSATLLVDLSPNAGDMAQGYFDFVQGLGRGHNMGPQLQRRVLLGAAW